MKGYSKIKEINNPFAQKSRSKKEFQFLDQDVDLHYSTPSSKKPQDLNPHQPPTTIVDETKNREKNVFFLGKSHHEDVQQEEEEKDDVGDNNRRRKSGVTESFGASLRRNFSVSSATSAYQKNRGINNNKNSQLERQSSTRSIQDAVRRAFSMRRASSVNNSDRYCRIYDQPMIMDGDDNYDYHSSNYHQDFEKRNNYNNNNNDDDNINGGSMEIRSMSMKKKEHHHYGNNGKRHVGSKVVKACKRLFSR